MGCISSKEFSQERSLRKGSLDRRVAHVNSSRTDVKLSLIDKKKNGSVRLVDDPIERKELQGQKKRNKGVNYETGALTLPNIERKKMEKLDVPVSSHPIQGIVLNSLEAEQVAAGWPSWLASAAGEALKGWIPRRASTFEKLDRIGQGTYSNVYRARDLTHDKIVALKKVRFDNKDLESVKFMAREIMILRKLDHPNIIKLEGLITSQTSSSLYLVFEYMEHDLTGLVSLPGINFTESQIKCYMQQLLSGLEHCHSHNVLHRDIKGSNLLIDNNGILKIADFGLATFFDPQSCAQLTSRVVTLWYRAPELLLGAFNYGVAVDLWSTGCILGELYTGKPILPGRTEVEQLHKIFKLCGSPSEDYWRKAKLPHSSVIKPQRPYRRCVADTFKDFPASAVYLMDTLLSMDPAYRGTTTTALNSEYFTTKPYACDPSTLPKYPPSKEMDTKQREEEAKRQDQQEVVRVKASGPKVAHVVHESHTNPDIGSSMQRRRPSNLNNREEIFNSHKDHTISRFLIDSSKQSRAARDESRESVDQQLRKVSHSGPLVPGAGWKNVIKGPNYPYQLHGRTNLSTLSGLVATRASLPEDRREKPSILQPEVMKEVRRSQRARNGLTSTARTDQNHQSQKIPDSPSGSGSDESGTKEPIPYGRGPQENKIYVSGPLLVPSNNVEQMLKDHDRRIQEFARRRIDKTKLEKMNSRGN